MYVRKIFFPFIISICCVLSVSAQHTSSYQTENATLSEAMHLFDNQKYAAAQNTFYKVLQSSHSLSELEKIDAEFFHALCGLYLFNSDAERLIKKFISSNSHHPRIYQAYFEYANFLFSEQKYPEALQWYELVDMERFSNFEVSEYFYKRGYCYFKANEFEKSKPYFKETKDAGSLYSENSSYYYAYLEYLAKNYDVALQGFQKLADSSVFSTVVPPYICQIYYYQKEYDKLIEYARSVEDVVNPLQLPHIYRVLAGAYFQTLQYPLALPYYEKYLQTAVNPSKADYYELGYLYYRTAKYEKAIENFKEVTSYNDTLAQNAYYHLADCYLKLDKKHEARNAFLAASQYSVFPKIKEEAFFNHIKLLYELSYAPFNEAIIAMTDFMKMYPKSTFKNEAYSLLVKIYMGSKNYKDALISLEQISDLSTDLKMAYQSIAYYRALELFNNLNFKEAVGMFDKSMEFKSFDRSIAALCLYWKAEALYRMGEFKQSRALFLDFITQPGKFNSPEYYRAHYNIAYTFFELKEYSQSGIWFRKYVDIVKDKSNEIYADAALRAGDSYFMNREISQALRFYSLSAKQNGVDVEYAIFQEAFCLGLVGNYPKKIEVLKQFLQNYSHSQYYDDALFELAEAYIKTNEISKAIVNYEALIANFKSSVYVKKSLLQIAYLVYSTEKYDESLDLYRKIIEQYPNSQESQTAYNMVKNIFKKKNDIDGLSNFIKQSGGDAKITEAQLDSLAFDVIQALYLNKQCDKVQPLLTNYIQKYNEGMFLLQVYYYRADCLYSNNFEFEALPDYEYVLRSPVKKSYTEVSLVNAIKILTNQSQWQKVIEYATRLENAAQEKSNLLFARQSLITAYEKLNDYSNLILVVNKYVVSDKISDDNKRWANMKKAIAYDNLLDTVNAQITYRVLAQNFQTIEGAEAKYRIIETLYKQKKYVECEKEVVDFLEKNSPHQYWLGKTYIIWAHLFINREEFFQARYTLQNVIEYYKITDDGVTAEANDLLNLIADLEIKQTKQTAPEVEVDMQKN